MKSLKTLILIVVLFSSSSAFCKDKAFQIGLKGGLNIYSLLNPSAGFSSNFATGFHAGIITSINFDSSNFSIRPEVLFNRVGADLEQFTYSNYTNLNLAHTSSTHLKYAMTFDYIQVPVLLSYQFSGGVSIAIGPYAGYLLKARSDSSVFISFKDSSNIPSNIAKSSSGSGSLDVINSMNKLDFGAMIGLNYESAKGFGMQFRYSYGITNVFQSTTFINPSSKISTFQPAYGNNSNISISIYHFF